MTEAERELLLAIADYLNVQMQHLAGSRDISHGWYYLAAKVRKEVEKRREETQNFMKALVPDAPAEPVKSCETCLYEDQPDAQPPCNDCVDGSKKPYGNWQPRAFQPPQDGEVKVGKPYVFVPPAASPECDPAYYAEQQRLDTAAKAWLEANRLSRYAGRMAHGYTIKELIDHLLSK
jgi:hypothetical protein